MPKIKKAVEYAAEGISNEDKIAALEAELAKLKSESGTESVSAAQPTFDASAADVLARAIANATTAAINASKPIEKKSIITYKGDTPWHKAGEAHVKAKRKYYIHSLLIDPDFHSNEEITLLNKVRPGRYLDGFVTVERRRDKGINVQWPIKTPDQKMRLASTYGIITLTQLLQHCIDEAAAPKRDFMEDVDE
jgi:hypothetical protein